MTEQKKEIPGQQKLREMRLAELVETDDTQPTPQQISYMQKLVALYEKYGVPRTVCLHPWELQHWPWEGDHGEHNMYPYNDQGDDNNYNKGAYHCDVTQHLYHDHLQVQSQRKIPEFEG